MGSRRLPPRILFLVAALALFGAGGFLAWFESWRVGRIIDLACRSEVAKLPSGDMEFAVRGNGRPVLVFHSAPGGYDQSLALAGFLEDSGFQIIAPSRPGYLRTPLATGSSPEKQAAAAAQLLDRLEIPKAAVIGLGWGSSTALEFAKLFPGRTAALVLVSAVTSETPPAPGIPLPQAVAQKLGSDPGSWMLARRAVRHPAEVLGKAFDLASSAGPADRAAWIDAILRDPGQIERLRDTVLSLAPLSSREAGLRNDLIQPPVSLRGLKPPVLLVHGGMDRAVPPGKLEKGGFPPAEILLLPGEGHLVLLGSGAPPATSRVVDFLNRHLPAGTLETTTDGQ